MVSVYLFVITESRSTYEKKYIHDKYNGYDKRILTRWNQIKKILRLKY